MSVLFDERRQCRFWTDPATAADVGIWQDAQGNLACFLFIPQGTMILGGDRASPMAPRGDNPQPWPGIYDDLPADLKDLLTRRPFGDSFPIEEVTFCIWNGAKGLDWKKGKFDMPKREPAGDPDGSKYLLSRMKEYFDHFDHF